jgi:hypothetical protein
LMVEVREYPSYAMFVVKDCDRFSRLKAFWKRLERVASQMYII